MDLHTLWVDLNRPSPEKFRLALRRKGIAAPSVADIRNLFYKYQSSKQIFAPAPKYKGKIFSPGLDRRWAADIMITAGHHTLIVQDIFSRYAWAEPIESPLTAYKGMAKVLSRAGKDPDELTTDADPGFQTKDFNELVASKGIHHTFRVGRNDLASVDRLISTIKRALATDEADGGSASIASVVAGYNDTSHPRLMGAPDDLRKPGGGIGNKLIYFHREEEEARNIEQNTDEIKKQAGKLEGQGFRVFKHKESLGRRIGEARWDREVHTGVVDGAYVRDETGEYHPTKEVLPVPKESTELAEPVARINPKAQGLLRRYADRAEAYLTAKEDRRDYASNLHKALSRDGYNIREAVQLAGLSTKSVIASFVRAFPNKFKLVTAKKGGTSFVELK